MFIEYTLIMTESIKTSHHRFPFDTVQMQPQYNSINYNVCVINRVTLPGEIQNATYIFPVDDYWWIASLCLTIWVI